MSNIVLGYTPTDFHYIMASKIMPDSTECENTYTIISDASCVPFPTPSQDFLNQVAICSNIVINTYNSQINGNNTVQLECKQVVSYTDYGNLISGNCSVIGDCVGNVATYSNVCTYITSNISSVTDLKSIPDYNNLMINCLANVDSANNNTTRYSQDYIQWQNWQDMSMNCYKKELCVNKKYVSEVDKLQNNHLGSDQNLSDSKRLYDNEYSRTGNLVLSIGIILIAIYYMNKP